MGRLYRPVEVSFNGRKKVAVAIVDTGADETVISERLARQLNAELYCTYLAKCASQTILTGKYADIMIKELNTGKEAIIEAGVSNIPFDTDDIDEEGLDVILGVDFIQETDLLII